MIVQERGGNKKEGTKIKTNRNGSSTFSNIALNSKNVSIRLDINEITVGINTMRNNLLSLFTTSYNPKKFEYLKKFDLMNKSDNPDTVHPDPDPINNNTRMRELIIDLR